MGTYATFCAEVRRNGRWILSNEEVFPFPRDAWQREKGDNREFWEFPFPSQRYGLFGFLAGIRNDSKTIVLAEPRGLPDDASDDSVHLLAPNISPDDRLGTYGGPPPVLETVADRVHAGRGDNYGYSWISLAELHAFDYSKAFTDQQEDPPLVTTYREFLDDEYFKHFGALQRLGAPTDVRMLFCFNG